MSRGILPWSASLSWASISDLGGGLPARGLGLSVWPPCCRLGSGPGPAGA